MSSPRSMFFYSDWPLGYHNQEAERKARHFASAGWDVVYVAGVGTRNPRLSSAGKLIDRTLRRLRHRPQHVRAPADQQVSAPGLRTAPLLVAPPRQLGVMRRFNSAWVERQLRRAVPDWSRAVAWIRHAGPELVPAIGRLDPAAVVYELVDAHHESPGMTGVWREAFDAAEAALVRRADLVVVTAASLAPRLEGWGADVRLVPHGVELFEWRPRDVQSRVTLGFLGVLDVRLDVAVIRHIAQARPQWRIRLVGPVERGFDPREVANLPNVSVERPVPHALIGEVLAEFDVGLLAYADSPVYRHMSPLKNLELMAAGRAAVVRPTPALEPFADVLYFAATPEEFLAGVERALGEDGPLAAARRRRIAESNAWQTRLQELDRLLEGALRR